MCGRYRLKEIRAIDEVTERVFGFRMLLETPRYNVAPSQTLPVVRAHADGAPQPALMRWGLVPFWEKAEKPKIAPINARAEDVFSKPMFRQSLQRRRCLVPADGIYEWKKLEGDLKLPYAIQRRGGAPFWFAGIHENSTEKRPETFALLTTGPNALMERIHNRMPVMLDDDRARKWLAPGDLTESQLREYAQPYPAADMEAYVVSKLVNNPRDDPPEVSAPVEELLPPDAAGGPNSA